MLRPQQAILIGSTLLGAWLAMQAVHELGHVLGAWATGGRVAAVVWHPLTISRTDVAHNPYPLVVAWAGPVVGVVAPLVAWAITATARARFAFVLRFFAGFCLVANGLYIAFGTLGRVGDSGELLRHGAGAWQLWLFGAVTAPLGFWLWHRQGVHFGLGTARGEVDRTVAYGALAVCIALVALALVVGGE